MIGKVTWPGKPWMREIDRHLHPLWTAAVGTEGYVKRSWQMLERSIEYACNVAYGGPRHQEALNAATKRCSALREIAKQRDDYRAQLWDEFELAIHEACGRAAVTDDEARRHEG